MLIFLVISIKYFPWHCNSTTCIQNNPQTKTVLLKNNKILVIVAQSEVEKERGLGGRDGLKENEGMLFVFDKPNTSGFWMKDMKFSIDIVWIRDDKVIDIKKSVSKDTYPTIFYPKESANMVLELPSGFCDTHNITVGDSFIQIQ